jgi:hypothetical protein
MHNVFRKQIITTFFLCLVTKNLDSLEKKEESKKTLMILAMQSADTFAKEPRKLDKFLESYPELKNNTYFKCVKGGFAAHPELGKPAPTLNTIAYKLGLRHAVPSSEGFFAGLRIQFGCFKRLVDDANL